MSTLIAFNRRYVVDLLLTWTPEQLFEALNAGRFGTELQSSQVQDLLLLTQAWKQRALGVLPLRDAMLVDPHRGTHVYSLLCETVMVACHPLTDEIAAAIRPADGGEIAPQHLSGIIGTLRTRLHTAEQQDQLAGLQAVIERAEGECLTLLLAETDQVSFPLPAELDALRPPLPIAAPRTRPRFEYPTGWRRNMAMGLALLGVGLLALPLLMGQLPSQTAGMPLALLTLALMIGIKASWPGFSGAGCIWLVPNLPGFHHGSLLTTLWPGIPLLLIGILLLSSDRQVRAMWRAVWKWMRG